MRYTAENMLLSVNQLQDVVTEPLFWKDKQGHYLGCNAAFLDTLGYSHAEEILGKTNHHFFSEKNKLLADQADLSVISSGEKNEIEETYQHKQGHSLSGISHRLPLKNPNNEIIGVIVYIRNIVQSPDKFSNHARHTSDDSAIFQRERRNNKSQLAKLYSEITGQPTNTNESSLYYALNIRNYLEKIIDLIPGHVYWADKNGVYLGCNQGILNFLHLKSREDFIGKTVYDFAPQEIADTIFSNDQEVIKKEKMISYEEHAVDEENKSTIYLTYKVPLFNHANEVSGMLGVSVDITARVDAEEQLKVEKERAEEANRTKTDFIHNMSHDIRTPMNGIIGGSDLLLHLETDPTKRELIEAINKSARRLFTFINDIVEFASIEYGSQKIEMREFDIKAIVGGVIDMMTPQTQHQHLKINAYFDSHLPEILEGDAKRLERVLLNLVGNAIKFTHEGGVTISVKIGKRDETEKLIWLIIEVQDTGIGIPEDKVDYIFDKFTRVSGSYEGKYKGAGLGLSIVKQFVEEMGGRIRVISELEKGSNFICQLPFTCK